jgi:hypothetical protein
MVIAFANNQTMIADQTVGSSIITTDPVPMDGNDRVTPHLNVESIFNALAGLNNGISYQGEVSNDGQNWFPVPTLTDYADAVTTVPKAKTIAANGAFLRFTFTFKASVGNIGGVTFDLHVLLDHA